MINVTDLSNFKLLDTKDKNLAAMAKMPLTTNEPTATNGLDSVANTIETEAGL